MALIEALLAAQMKRRRALRTALLLGTLLAAGLLTTRVLLSHLPVELPLVAAHVTRTTYEVDVRGGQLCVGHCCLDSVAPGYRGGVCNGWQLWDCGDMRSYRAYAQQGERCHVETVEWNVR